MLTVSGLIQGLAEVLVHYPGDLAHVVGVEDHVPGQVLGRPLQLLLSVALPATPENISKLENISQTLSLRPFLHMSQRHTKAILQKGGIETLD